MFKASLISSASSFGGVFTREEVSYFVIADNKILNILVLRRTTKRVFENDKGPNTGGMGAYSPAPLITKILEKIIDRIINPTLSALKKKGYPYNGFLYAGLMIVKNEPFLIEYNIRMRPRMSGYTCNKI